MSWWVVVPPLLAGAVIVLLPGMVVAYGARLRGITAWGMAPVLSLSAYTLLGVVFGIPHVSWNLLTVGLGMAVIVAAAVLVSRLLLRSSRASTLYEPWSVGAAALADVLVAAVLIGVRFALVFAHPDNISQTFDNNFHLNGVRYILATGDADPFTFSDLQYAYDGIGSFYPDLWHMVAALIVQASGAAIPVAANAFAMVIGGLIWPLGCVFLVRQLAGARPVAVFAAGILSAAFAAFPLLLVDWGVLYPNLLGLALLPAGLGLLVLAVGLGTDAQARPALAWIAFVVALPGVALAHPNAFVTLLLVGAPAAAAGAWAMLRRRHAAWWAWMLGVIVAAGVGWGLWQIFLALRPPASAATWGPISQGWPAAQLGLTNGEFGAPAIIVTALAALGVVTVIVQRRHRWLIVSLAVVEVLFYLCATLPMGPQRLLWTSTWYSDINRFIAQIPVVQLPLAALGVLGLGAALGRLFGHRAARFAVPIVTTVLAVVLGLAPQGGTSMANATARAQGAYALSATSGLLTADDLALIEQLPALTPADAVIAGDPWTGTAMAWAIGDRRVIAPHVYVARTPATALILARLADAYPGSSVCTAVAQEHVGYALDFGSTGVFGPTNQFPGVHDLADSGAVTLVKQVGTAALYRVTGC
jgi:hypothetical protein